MGHGSEIKGYESGSSDPWLWPVTPDLTSNQWPLTSDPDQWHWTMTPDHYHCPVTLDPSCDPWPVTLMSWVRSMRMGHGSEVTGMGQCQWWRVRGQGSRIKGHCQRVKGMSPLTTYQGPFTHERSVRVAERLALPTSDHGVAGSNPAGGEVLPEPKQRLIAQSLSCSPFHRLEMTEILLKGCKTPTHPSTQSDQRLCCSLPG